MSAFQELRAALPDVAKDVKNNLQMVFTQTSLSPAQKWGVAYAVALANKHAILAKALAEEALAEQVSPEVLEDARAAAVLMAMNNVYYRFRHYVERPEYADKPARLRMTRLLQPSADKLDLELFCLAVSAVNGCATCVRGHEKVVTSGGLTEDQVNDAIRVAAVVNAAAVALAL